jgi:hypothetical protein
MQDSQALSQRVWGLSSDLASLLINRTNLAAVEECLINSWKEAATLINSLHRAPRFLGISRNLFDSLNLSRLHATAVPVQTMLTD